MKIIFLIIWITIVVLYKKIKSIYDNKHTKKTNIFKEKHESNTTTKLEELTIESIENTPDSKLEWNLHDYIIDNRLVDYDNEYETVLSLPEGLIMLYTTWLLEMEVNNGGFDQFFFNSSSELKDETYEGFLKIKAIKHAELLKQASKIYYSKVEIPKDIENAVDIEDFIESFKSNKLNELDDLFYNIDENLSELRIRWIRENMDKVIYK